MNHLTHSKPLLIMCALLSAAPALAGNFPQDYQAALRLYETGKIAEANDAFAKLSESGPNQPAKDAALVQAAYCEARLKHAGEAEALVTRIKDRHLGVLCRMNLLTFDNKFADIVTLSKDEDIEQWPDALAFDALFCRGSAFARTRDAGKAEKDFRAAIQHTVSDYNKGQTYLKLGALFGDADKTDQRALDAFAAVYSLKPGLTVQCRAVLARAKLLASQGKRDAAIAEFDHLKDIKTQPHWSIGQMGLAEVYEALGAKDQALACYKAVIASEKAPADMISLAKSKLNITAKP